MIEKIDDNFNLENHFKHAKELGRKILNKYFSNIPYSKNDKVNEINFFYNTINFINKKWILEILWELETYKGFNFNELKRQIKGISSRILSDRLKDLEENGIIERNVQDTRPPSVLYKLSKHGQGFVELMTLVILYLKHKDSDR